MYARIVLGSLWRHRARAAVALAAVTVPTALVAAVANFALDARAKMSVELRKRGANVVADGDVAVPGVPSTRWAAWEEEGAAVVGIDGAFGRFREGWELRGRWPQVGECVLGSAREGGLGRRVVGVVETGDAFDHAVFVPLDRPAARTEFSVPGTVAEVEAFAARIPGARVVRQIAETEEGLLSKLTLSFGLVAAFVLAISALGMATSLSAAVVERRREIGLLKALGATDGGVARVLAGELGALLLAGAVAGGIAGLALSEGLSRAVFGMGVGLRPGAIALGVAACVAVAAAGSLVPLRGALAVEPARVLKEE